ncbi:hypothetical protein BJ166DRAFT_77397 [Pestalotiopsis sp. NC0098]|nr:hypothetical protein BJ166DRAFT_77397 [Pestalotiopsis sp. NC0098]
MPYSGISGTRDSFLVRLKPCRAVFDKTPIFTILLRPLLLLANPVITWAVIAAAFGQLWNVVISIVLAQIFSAPSYSLDTARLGYINTGPIVAGIVSCLACGLLSDSFALFMSRKNHGIYEPEFRLSLMILSPIFSSIGYFLFGYLSANGSSPVLLSFVWGIGFVSAQVISTAVSTYLVDAYRDVDVDIFVLSMSVKNLLFLGFSCEFFVGNPQKIYNASICAN